MASLKYLYAINKRIPFTPPFFYVCIWDKTGKSGGRQLYSSQAAVRDVLAIYTTSLKATSDCTSPASKKSRHINFLLRTPSSRSPLSRRVILVSKKKKISRKNYTLAEVSLIKTKKVTRNTKTML